MMHPLVPACLAMEYRPLRFPYTRIIIAGCFLVFGISREVCDMSTASFRFSRVAPVRI